MTTRDEVLDKLAKLFALTQSDNEHEAALAAQRAGELMAKHQLDAAEVYAHATGHTEVKPEQGRIDADDGDAEWSKREEAWMTQLGASLADGLGGKMWRLYGHKVFKFYMVGPPDSVAAARYLFLALKNEVNRLGRLQMRTRNETNAWRRAYCHGVVMRISHRLKQGRQQVLSTSTAMVHVQKMDQAIEAAMDALNLRGSKQGRTKRGDAIGEGYRDGANVDLSDALDRRRIGTGPKKLPN